jgi:hypothetical protein
MGTGITDVIGGPQNAGRIVNTGTSSINSEFVTALNT